MTALCSGKICTIFSEKGALNFWKSCTIALEYSAKTMYKPIDKLQHSFLDFNQPMGLHMNPDNRWVRLADRIPWC